MSKLPQLLERARKLVRSQSSEGMALAAQALEIARGDRDAYSEAMALTVYAYGLQLIGRVQDARDTLLSALEIGEKRAIGTARGEALEITARIAYTQGQYEQAADCWCACTELPDHDIAMSQRIQAHIGLGQLCYAHDHFELALAHHKRASDLSEDHDNPHLMSAALINIASDQVKLGHLDEACSALKAALPLVRAEENYQFEAEIFAMFGQIRLVREEYDAARMSLIVALKINRLLINSWGEIGVMRGLGQCALASGDMTMAADQFSRARALAEATGAQPLLAELLRDQAKLAQAQGQLAEAEELNTRSEAMQHELKAAVASPRFATLELRLAD
ncbi:hypothetical protein ACTSKR_15385 [Chitinibacteraceae bacterium HSL-7]